MGSANDTTRRPIKSRDHRLSKKIAGALAAGGLTPNSISVLGMCAGIAAGVAFAATAHLAGAAGNEGGGVPWRIAWLLGAAFTQMRLLANMFDGMVAIETGKQSPVGELFNEIPDRISDAAILIGLGYASASSPALGFACACAAIFTAYIRAMGASLGNGQDFCGPLAKPQRMFLVTLAGLYGAATPAAWKWLAMGGADVGFATIILALILAGTLFTALRRLRRLARTLATPS